MAFVAMAPPASAGTSFGIDNITYDQTIPYPACAGDPYDGDIVAGMSASGIYMDFAATGHLNSASPQIAFDASAAPKGGGGFGSRGNARGNNAVTPRS